MRALDIANWPVRRRLAAVAVAGTLVPLVALASVAYARMKTLLHREAGRLADGAAEDTSLDVDSLNHSCFDLVREIAHWSTIERFIAFDSCARGRESGEVGALLEAARSGLPHVSNLVVTDARGHTLAATNERLDVPESIARAAFASADARGRAVTTAFLGGSRIFHAIFLSRVSANGGPSLGAVLACVPARVIAERLEAEERMTMPPGSLLLVLDGGGRLVAGRAPVPPGTPVLLPEKLEPHRDGQPLGLDVYLGPMPGSGAESFAHVDEVTSAPWSVVAFIPLAAVRGPLRALALEIGLVASVLLAGSLVVSRWIGRTIVARIDRLAGATDRIRRGDLSVRVRGQSRDELGGLARAFNEMAEALSITQEEIEAKVRERTAELERANGELERAGQQKARFLANMSHELRSPLNAVIGFTELVLEDGREALGPVRCGQLANALAAARALLEVVTDLIDMARIDAGSLALEKSPMLPADAVAEVVARFRGAVAKKRIRIEPVTRARRLVQADPRRLSQVLAHLLSNAIKFSPEDGAVEVRVEDEGAGSVRFSIRDEGPGVAPDFVADLFKPLHQSENPMVKKHPGTGLGLAISKAIVEAHGGEISLETEAGKGATFWFRIPAAADPAALAESPSSVEAAARP